MPFQDIMLFSKAEAIKKYGKPHFNEQFILNNALGRFRIGLYKEFTKEDLLKNSILIDEITWEKDKNTWVTVWYQVTNSYGKPKNSYEWTKGTDFYNINL